MTKTRSKKPTVLICDDETQFSTSIAASLSEVPVVGRSFEVVAADPAEFKAAVTDLERRRRGARGGNAQDQPESSTNLIDRADVLIVDYDLMRVYDDSYLTGEVVAYLARCYSTCGVIIGVNQFGENSFDLTLTREASSYADFNVGALQITKPSLWSAETEGFRPWRWPNVLDGLDAKRQRERELKNAMDKPITGFFGLRDANTFPREMTEFVKVSGKDIDTITFRDFVDSSGNGLRRKDQAGNGADVRIAAARLAKWLEDVVLPAQDILVDAPHLVSRIPELLVGKIKNLETWNRTVGSELDDLGIRHELLKPFEFKRRNWLDRPAWFWRELRESDSIQKLRSASRKDVPPDYVFCEDISRFVARSEAREFVAEVPSAFNRRYVADPKKIKAPSAERQFLAAVTYQPEVRLAL